MQQHPNTKTQINITEEDLPLCCPTPSMIAWNSHPRVFLEIEKMTNGEIICPYCSTTYRLKTSTKSV